MKKGRHSIVFSTAIGTLLSMISSLILCSVTTYLIHKQKIGWGTLPYIVPVIHGISAFAGSIVAKYLSSERRGVAAFITGCGFILLLIIINLLFADGQFNGVPIACLFVILGCGTSVLLFNSTKGFGKIHRRKVRIR